MLKIGIVGCGAMGQIIAQKIDEGLEQIKIAAVCDKESERAGKLASILTQSPQVMDLHSLISVCSVVVEATSFEAAPKIIAEALDKGRDVLALTVGALLNKPEIFRRAKEKQAKIYIPSGAIAGLDWLKAASLGKIRGLTLTTRKPIKGLTGAPYLKRSGINLADAQNEVLLFEGTVEEAIEKFPANINVAATLALATSGPEAFLSQGALGHENRWTQVKVKIVADPKLKRNTHQIKAEGELGKITLMVENLPSELNPRSSRLAAFSAVALLNEIASPVRIGT